MKNFAFQRSGDIELQPLSDQKANAVDTTVKRCWICLQKYRQGNKREKLHPCCKCRLAHSICMLNFSSTYHMYKCDSCYENYHVNVFRLIPCAQQICEIEVKKANILYRTLHLLSAIATFIASTFFLLYLAKVLLFLWLGHQDILVNDVMHISAAPTTTDLILAPLSLLIFLPTALLLSFLVFAFKNCIVSLGSRSSC